jgi:putative SOS response-associated peptidase YedK
MTLNPGGIFGGSSGPRASRDIAHIHDRMPVIVPPDAFDFWLDCTKFDATTAAALITPAPAGVLEVYDSFQ